MDQISGLIVNPGTVVLEDVSGLCLSGWKRLGGYG
jgi:hypothetical protein